MKRILDKIERPTVAYRFVDDLPLEGYIARENTKNIGERLKAEADPEMRRMLRRILAIEMVKFEQILAGAKVQDKESECSAEPAEKRR